MSSVPSSGVGLPMTTSLPQPIPPPMPLLPPTVTAPYIPPPPSQSSPLPPISTISNPESTTSFKPKISNLLEESSRETGHQMKTTPASNTSPTPTGNHEVDIGDQGQPVTVDGTEK